MDKEKENLEQQKKHDEEKLNKYPIEKFNIFQQQEALKWAHQIRMFEIELFWKRASYFWAFLIAVFAGYFLVQTKKDVPHSKFFTFMLSTIGFLCSLSWYLNNRGSKRWQDNWQEVVAELEDRVTGPLYKFNQRLKWKFWRIQDPYPFSTSQLYIVISFYITLIWLLLSIKALFDIPFGPFGFDKTTLFSDGTWTIIIASITIIFAKILIRNTQYLKLDKFPKYFDKIWDSWFND